MGVREMFSFMTRSSLIPSSAVFTLTQIGRAKAEEFGGDNKSRILVALETNGTSNLEEIARTSRINKNSVVRIIRHLIQSGYVQPVRGSEE